MLLRPPRKLPARLVRAMQDECLGAALRCSAAQPACAALTRPGCPDNSVELEHVLPLLGGSSQLDTRPRPAAPPPATGSSGDAQQTPCEHPLPRKLESPAFCSGTAHYRGRGAARAPAGPRSSGARGRARAAPAGTAGRPAWARPPRSPPWAGPPPWPSGTGTRPLRARPRVRPHRLRGSDAVPGKRWMPRRQRHRPEHRTPDPFHCGRPDAS